MRNLIIYVDDDRDDLAIFEEAFKDIPEYELMLLDKAENLFPIVDKNRDQICLLVLDINMPYNGIDILKSLKNSPKYSELPVIMLSSANSPRERSAIEKLHTELVEKPSSYPGLRGLADRLMKHCS